jgi:hypothetical protein
MPKVFQNASTTVLCLICQRGRAKATGFRVRLFQWLTASGVEAAFSSKPPGAGRPILPRRADDSPHGRHAAQSDAVLVTPLSAIALTKTAIWKKISRRCRDWINLTYLVAQRN